MKFFQNENLFRNNIRESSLSSPKTTLDRHKSWFGPGTNRVWDFSFFSLKKKVLEIIQGFWQGLDLPISVTKDTQKKINFFFQTWNLPRRVSFQDVRTKKNLTNYLTDPHVIHRVTDDFWKKKIPKLSLPIWSGFFMK